MYFREVHFQDLPYSTNIYGSCTFLYNGHFSLLVACRNQVFCLRSFNDGISVRWSSTPILLESVTSIDVDIISIDCFSKENIELYSNTPNLTKNLDGTHPVLALTIFNSANNDPLRKYYLNIYEANSDSKIPYYGNTETDISILYSSFDDCQSIPLSFVPFKLGHIALAKEQCILLSGGDNTIHLFRRDTTTGRFSETDIISHFPQLANLKSSAISFEFGFIKSHPMVTLGFQDGEVLLSLTEDSNDSVMMDGPVSVVALFHSALVSGRTFPFDPSVQRMHPAIAHLQTKITNLVPLSIFSEEDELSLLVADALGFAFVFRDVQRRNLKELLILPEPSQSQISGNGVLDDNVPSESSSKMKQESDDSSSIPTRKYSDSITCAVVADVDFDCQNEVVLGTYGQQVLIYKRRTIETRPNTDEVPSNKMKSSFFLYWQWDASQPIMSIHWADLTQEGANNLVVITLCGIHILQADLQRACIKICKAMEVVNEILLLEDQIQQETKKQEQLKALEQKIHLGTTTGGDSGSSS